MWAGSRQRQGALWLLQQRRRSLLPASAGCLPGPVAGDLPRSRHVPTNLLGWHLQLQKLCLSAQHIPGRVDLHKPDAVDLSLQEERRSQAVRADTAEAILTSGPRDSLSGAATPAPFARLSPLVPLSTGLRVPSLQVAQGAREARSQGAGSQEGLEGGSRLQHQGVSRRPPE